MAAPDGPSRSVAVGQTASVTPLCRVPVTPNSPQPVLPVPLRITLPPRWEKSMLAPVTVIGLAIASVAPDALPIMPPLDVGALSSVIGPVSVAVPDVAQRTPLPTPGFCAPVTTIGLASVVPVLPPSSSRVLPTAAVIVTVPLPSAPEALTCRLPCSRSVPPE